MMSSVLSMALMVLTSVYGYIYSHRAITAVLKDVSETMGEGSNPSQASKTLVAERYSLIRHSSDAHKITHHHPHSPEA